MAIKINSDGSWQAEYLGPYAGLHVQAPATNIPDNASPAFNNFMLRNAELRSRPNFAQYPGGSIPGYPLGVTTFLDANGNYHAVTWEADQLYQYAPSVPGWVDVGTASPGNMEYNPVNYQAFANILYYTNVGIITYGPHVPGGGKPPVITPFMAYWDGIAAAPVYTQTYSDASTSNSIAGISLTNSPTVGGSLPGAPTIVGPISIGAAYLAELDDQLILGNVTILDQGTGKIYNFPNLIWWSANGLPLQWDPTENVSAGFNPFLDVSDQITGLAMLGVAGYIFRNYGITQMAPTGQAITPWEFDHMWASNHGIGNVLAWSLAQYGPTCCFVAQDNIYSLSITNVQPIGGTARDAIMSDLANAAGPSFANIIPILVSGFTYLTYQLEIPFVTFIRIYLYSFEDQNWSTWDEPIAQSNPPLPQLTCAPNVV